MLLIDTEAKRIIDDDEIKDNMAALHDFSSYLKAICVVTVIA